MDKVQTQAISTLRVLAAETVQQANSGHPGIALGAAPMAYALFETMNHCPKNPDFFNRDRFVLSAGHGSALLYGLLHLFGYGITKEDLMQFRQLYSRTPGHPEIERTPGVETSTGPLGQGVANAVGFAIAESMLAAKYNKEDLPLVDHYTYALCGDGCMMEGIESEAASLAGTLKLGKLIVLYDSNDISIEGNTSIAFTEDVARRHEAQGWQVIRVNDGEDIDSVKAAIRLAKDEKQKPSLIVVRTTIGFGSPKAGSADSHGAPLGKDGIEALKKNLGIKGKPFEVPAEVNKFMAGVVDSLNKNESEWNRIAKAYKAKYPEDFEKFNAEIKGKAISAEQLENIIKTTDKVDASRSYSGTILNQIADACESLIGGSADLAPSNKTALKDKGDFCAENRTGRNIHFGVREHSMAAICNGIALHGGFSVFCSTFFVFTDYMKNAMRMSAIMNLPVTYILTHDSIGVGEDGPTHQPVEQLASLRCTPNIKVFRPCDSRETKAAYISALTGKGPTAIVCSRQNLEYFEVGADADPLKGGYIFADSENEVPDVILIATGSEVSLAMAAREQLKAAKIDARVVSMPCMELFEAQTAKYRESVLPSAVRARVAVEAGSSMPWGKYVGLDGGYVCMDGFGSSAPANKLFEIYGFTAENVVKAAVKSVRACK